MKRERLPWWKWLIQVVTLPVFVALACGTALVQVARDVPAACRQCWSMRPWGDE